MKHASTWITLALAAAVCAAAIVLPSHAVEWQDKQRWFYTVASEDISQADVSFNYALTTAERADLAAEYLGLDVYPGDSTLNISRDLYPSENEISGSQVLDAAFEELRELTRLGVLPQTAWDAARQVAQFLLEHGFTDLETNYYRLMDWEDTQRKLSLWVVSITFQPYLYASVAGQAEVEFAITSEELLPERLVCFMDAETGKCYFVSLMGGGDGTLTVSQIQAMYDSLKPEAWADYLGLTTPELTEPEPEWKVYHSDSEEPEELEDPVKVAMTFPQEELDLHYYLIFQHTEFTANYSEKMSQKSCWFQLSYSPVWPR